MGITLESYILWEYENVSHKEVIFSSSEFKYNKAGWGGQLNDWRCLEICLPPPMVGVVCVLVCSVIIFAKTVLKHLQARCYGCVI